MLGFVLAYALIATSLVGTILRAKNVALPPDVRAFEDAEQMDAVRPKSARGSWRDTLTGSTTGSRRTDITGTDAAAP